MNAKGVQYWKFKVGRSMFDVLNLYLTSSSTPLSSVIHLCGQHLFSVIGCFKATPQQASGHAFQ